MYDKPANILEYLFMYSYIISILASIIFSVYSVLSIDISNILFNRTATVILGYYLGLCGFISLTIWLNFSLRINTRRNCSGKSGNEQIICENSIDFSLIPYHIFNYFFWDFNRKVVITRLN